MEPETPNKILIVDDEAHIRMLIEQTLEDLDDDEADILTAVDGEEALRIILDEKPRVVFLDVMIPKINGVEVCRIVKRENKMEDVYVILLTAQGQANDRQAGFDAGANAYITKPFNPDELLDLTRQGIGV